MTDNLEKGTRREQCDDGRRTKETLAAPASPTEREEKERERSRTGDILIPFNNSLLKQEGARCQVELQVR